MIIKFKIFERVIFDMPLNYGEAVNINKSERNIREHFKKYYSRMSISLLGSERSIGISRADMSDIRTKNLIKFAKEEQDDELLQMISDHLELIQRIKIIKNSEKFNL
jgi:hypothetical protein